MNRPSAGWIVCLLLCGMLIAGVFYLIGYKAAYDRMENTVPSTVEVTGARRGVTLMWKLISGLLALPVLLVLSVLMIFRGSGDYVRTVQLNWELELPASEGCLYETDSGASFSGDGERYHVLAYADDSGLEETLTEEATPVRSAEVPVTEILDLLAVPADQRPDFSDCRGFTAAHPTDERNRLYLLVNSAGTRLYVVECFF